MAGGLKRGVFLFPNKDDKSLPKFKEWVKLVRAAAIKEAKKKPKPPPKCPTKGDPNLDVKKSVYGHPDYEKRRCKGINRSKTPNRRGGKRCKMMAMRGADYCHRHGGYYQQPHRAVKYLDRIEGMAADKEIYPELFRETTREARDAANAFIKEAGMGMRVADLYAGAVAYLQDDGGKQWRRWTKDIEQRAEEMNRKRKYGLRKDVVKNPKKDHPQ